jgi:GAF domain-containing protein
MWPSSLRMNSSRRIALEFVEGLQLGATQVLRVDHLDDAARILETWLTEVSADKIIAVPLTGSKGVIGALCVDKRSGRRRFGADDQILLDRIGNHAVVAIENAGIIDDLRTAQNEVQRADGQGTLGTLAAGLVHEINNSLVSIQTFASLVPEKRMNLDDAEFRQADHQLACSELDRIREWVATMS